MAEPNFTFHAPAARSPSTALTTVPASKGKPLATRGNNFQRSGGPAQSMNSHLALNALRRWWMIALPIGFLLSAAAAGLVYWSFEPQYEAVAQLEISEATPYIAFDLHEGGVSMGYFRTQIENIRSPWLLGYALEKINNLPEISKQSDPIQWLRKKVNVKRVNDSNILEIKYASADPASAKLVVNEVTHQYLKTQEVDESARVGKIIEKLNKELEYRRETAKTLRQQVESARQQVGSAELSIPPDEPENARGGEEKPAVKNPVTELQSRLVNVQADQAMLEARIQALQEEIAATEAAPAGAQPQPAIPRQRACAAPPIGGKAVASSSPPKVGAEPPAKRAKRPLTPDEKEWVDNMVEHDLENSGDVRQLESQLMIQHTHLERLEKKYVQGKKDPLYIEKQNELKLGEKTLDDLKKRLRPLFEKDAEFAVRNRPGEHVIGPPSEGTRLEQRKEELARLKSELRGMVLAEANLRAKYKAQLKEFLDDRGKFSEQILNLKVRKDELSEAQSVVLRIEDRVVQLQTEQSRPLRVWQHGEVQLPQVPVEVLPYRNMSLAGLLAFCLPFGLAVAWEVRARRIGSPDELEQQVHLAVLGEIARLPTRVRATPQISAKKIGSDLRIFEESIDSLRTALTLSDELRDMRILAVTSAANHEGKTSVASQLALSLARATGKATLLIDGDMRSPDVHSVFGVVRGPGLAEVLGNECSLTDAIVGTHNPNVQLLPAGRLKVSPHRLLGNGAWKSLLAQIPASYGYVIIDTPPVLAASEALVLAKHADAILICVMRDVSRADQVRKASNLLTAAGGCPVGTVLNGVPISRYKYYYGTYPARTAPTH